MLARCQRFGLELLTEAQKLLAQPQVGGLFFNVEETFNTIEDVADRIEQCIQQMRLDGEIRPNAET